MKYRKKLQKQTKELEGLIKKRVGTGKRYVANPNYVEFAKNLIIRSGTKLCRFNLYDYQIKINQAVETHRRTQIIKCRQTGVSAWALSKLGHKAILNPAFMATVFAQNQSDTSEFALRLQNMVYHLKTQGLSTDSDNKLEFSPTGGGRVLFRNSASENPRGIPSVTYNVFDEAAFPANIDLLYAAAIPSQSMLGDEARTIIISSPNGVGNWFYDQMIDGNECDILQVIEDIRAQKLPPYYEVEDRAGGVKCIVHWRAHPIYGKDDGYLEKVQAQTGLPWDKVLQEYDLDFTKSDEMVFDSGYIRLALDDEECPYEWCDAIFMGVDVATTGNDYTVATVLGLVDDTLYLLDYYRQRKQTSQYDIFQIGDLIERYKPDRVLIEKNHAGSVYVDDLADNHPDVFVEGLTTTKASKEAYMSKLKLTLERERIKIPKKNSVFRDELLQFRREPSGKLTAPNGKNDDCVMSLALAVYALGMEFDSDVLRVSLVKPS